MSLKKLLLGLIFVLSGLFTLGSPVEAAGSLSLAPGSGNFPQGSSFGVAVNVNTGGEAVNAVEVTLHFPADKLKANYISHTGSAFDVNAESSIGGGVVRIAKGKIPPAVVGFKKVATVGFTSLSQGTAVISISGESKVLRETDSVNILASVSGATFNITTAVVQPTPQPAQDQQGPKISDVKVVNLGAQTATISWKTDEKADSQIEYGFVTNRQEKEFKYFFTAQLADLVMEHELALDPKTLIPGYLYHFQVSSKDEANHQAVLEDSTFILPGYPFKLTINDIQSTPVEGAKVRLLNLGLETITDKNGQVEFKDLPVGDLSILVEYRGQIQEKSTKVLADSNKLTIVLGQKIAKPQVSLIPVGIAFTLLILATIVVLFWRYWRRKQVSSPNSRSGLPPRV